MTLQLSVEPADALIDQPRRLSASGLAQGIATLVTTLEHPDGSYWRSEARFAIDETGVLDVDAQLPVEGDWTDSEPMAWVWAMQSVAPPQDVQRSEGVAPLTLIVQLQDASARTAHMAVVQRFVAPGVTRREVREQGLSGTLFVPPGEGPHPVVIVLNGSGGGTPEQRAALYAAHGYVGFALAYFKAPGRPEHISDTPLEYFQAALEWATRTLEPQNGFIAVAGLSRGGELALLLAAKFPQQVSAVIGYVPSAVVHGTLRAGHPAQPRDADAWTWQGVPLANVWRGNPYSDWSAFDTPPLPGAPIRQAPAFIKVEQGSEFVALARIPVERIEGPVLLISGTDDGFWPSSDYSDRIEADLRAVRHPWPVEHVCNEGAGHAIGFPGVITSVIARVHPVAGVLISGGGTAAANARANRRSWSRVLAFLATAVETRGQRS